MGREGIGGSEEHTICSEGLSSPTSSSSSDTGILPILPHAFAKHERNSFYRIAAQGRCARMDTFPSTLSNNLPSRRKAAPEPRLGRLSTSSSANLLVLTQFTGLENGP